MRRLNIVFISLSLFLFSQVCAGKSQDLTILFTQSVQGELYPCG